MTDLPSQFESRPDVMRHAIELARQGLGYVEPNPPVGAILVDAELRLLGAGWHEEFGGAHAEINALADFERRFPHADERSQLLESSTLFVTLEPCCHHGKTPPCSQAVIDAGIRHVMVGTLDRSSKVNGGGIRQLQEAGIDVASGLLEREACDLVGPFLKLARVGRPWVHAKWAMTLDGKIATRTGESQWISNEESRAVVHELRGRMDAIIVGGGTARADNPRLTARPPGPRVATRIIVSSRADIAADSHLVTTAREIPVLVAHGNDVAASQRALLEEAGVELLACPADDGRVLLPSLLDELGRRSMTNVLVEGGSELLGSLFDERLVDEMHVFIGPKLFGGADAPGPVNGHGVSQLESATQLQSCKVQQLGNDVYCRGSFVGSFQPCVG